MKQRLSFRPAILLPLLFGLAATASPALTQQARDGAPPRVIRVAGTGEVQATPDMAHIDLAVENTATTARAAGEENARAMDRVIRALTAAGVPRTDIETRRYSLIPQYAPPQRMPTTGVPEEPRIVGYRAVNSVSVRTRDLARVGPIIDAGLAAGANRMEGLRFSLQDADAAQADALRRATERARRSAEVMAGALGVRLGEVVEASTSLDVIQPVYQQRFERAMMADAAPPTPIQPGEQTVTATVQVVFAIQTP